MCGRCVFYIFEETSQFDKMKEILDNNFVSLYLLLSSECNFSQGKVLIVNYDYVGNKVCLCYYPSFCFTNQSSVVGIMTNFIVLFGY